MRRNGLWVFLVLAAILALVGCAPPAPAGASLGQPFTLSIGQSATIAAETMTIKFVDVVSDSRCPSGVQCIWAGEASSLVEITKSGTTFSQVLTVPGPSTTPQAAFAGYKIQFDLQPYPQAGNPISKGDYRLQLTISK